MKPFQQSLATVLVASSIIVPWPGWAAETVIKAELTHAPNVPPAVHRREPAIVQVELETREVEGLLMEGFEEGTKYNFWTFNGTVPGPFIRARVGDTLEVKLKNPK